MSLSIGDFSTNSLTAQPLGYDGESREGLTSRRWRIAGLLTAAEWDDLISEYDTWRNLRITDPDSVTANSIGSTVSFTGSGFGSGSWSAVACWFSSAPTAEQVGAYVSASAELVDATQALQVLLRQKEKQKQAAEDLPALGTITLGSVTLTLLDPPDGRSDVPTPTLTAAGRHYLSGTLAATKTRRVRAYVDGEDHDILRSWFDTTVAATPAVGDWYPTAFPEATAEVAVTDGVKATRYTVEISLVQIR